MRAQIEALAEELRHLRASGMERVFVSEETLERLRRAAGKARSETVEPEQEPVNEPEREAEVRSFAVSADALGARKGAPGAGAGLRWDGQPMAPLPEPPVVKLPKGSKAEQMAWLRDLVLNCATCREHVRPGRKVVFGVGSEEAEIFFCGEGPGADEEKQGEPFVGPAGQLLTKIIQAMGLTREQVYIGNIMKWRPEMPSEWGNREPTLQEVEFSLPYLRAQLEIVRPKVIVALGKTAVNGLLGHDPLRKMGAVRGRWQEFAGVPLMPTFHPSYLLRNAALAVKRQVWEDIMKVMEKAGMKVSEKQRGFFLSAK
ncbi:MAG: uracil-DNA glycosylase [Opitutales bacterium]|jgi:DNA polymerase